jgi:pimeloyl-ACP methyl ester carboxylesterase
MKNELPGERIRSTVHYRSVECAGVRIAYREAGPPDGPAIFLLHGFPTSSHMFRDLIPLLSDRYHLIAPDYPGFGYSATPSPEDFTYTFDHLADVMEAFVDAIGLPRYALYVQDFGGPVGFRLASRRPHAVTALLIQNANAYEDGVSDVVREVVLKHYSEPSPESAARLRELFELPVTMGQFLDGASDPELVSPDAWQHAQWGMDRPGNKAIQFAIHANYGSNVERYPEWHAYFRRAQPPALITWGRHDPIFIVGGALAYARDLAVAETHLLDAGHFALETHAFDIAMLVRDFLARYVDADEPAASIA